ncbi:MAG: hypothetical protein KAJ73_00645 [Zetaproteobacteria bacterium]|nr:hypothetical protein [Zetaproteobacteria bacterium]
MLHARQDYNERIQDEADLIPDEEPVLLLRAQDELACEAAAYYAWLCRRHQVKDVAQRIEDHSILMKDWPIKKLPDVPEGM